MDGITLDPSAEAGLLGASEFSLALRDAAQQASDVMLVLIALATVMLVVAALCEARERPAARRLQLARGSAVAAITAYGPVAAQAAQPVLVAAGGAAGPSGRSTSGPAEGADTSMLVGAGLSPTDVAALRVLRGRIRGGEVSEDSEVADHLSFARWLVDHGRLEG